MPCPWVATQTNNYKGLVQKCHKGIDYGHTIVHNLDYVSNILDCVSKYLDTRVLQREAGEKPPRGVGKRVRIRAYKPR